MPAADGGQGRAMAFDADRRELVLAVAHRMREPALDRSEHDWTCLLVYRSWFAEDRRTDQEGRDACAEHHIERS
jgi:hypothetical protein